MGGKYMTVKYRDFELEVSILGWPIKATHWDKADPVEWHISEGWNLHENREASLEEIEEISKEWQLDEVVQRKAQELIYF